jgi:hypothetical protein
MNVPALILRALQFLLLIVKALFEAKAKEEGRQEVRDQQEAANAEATAKADEIDALVGGSDISDLRDRMRHYQRPSDAP